MSVALCAHRFGDGTFCKRPAKGESRFCGHHQPFKATANSPEHHDEIHPLARLLEPKDVFNVVRETLNAVRQGRISPGQAYAVGYMIQVWLQASREVGYYERQSALESQFLPQVLEAEEKLAQKPGPIPLPVKIDMPAAVEQLMETEPPLALKPVSDYPGYDELVARTPRKANGND